jgi:hypothetical protein
MTTIKEHLEKAKFWNDTERVEQLEKVLSRGTLTLKEWSKLARFMPAEGHPVEGCVQIIEYIGEVYIQVLDTGEFQYKETKSTDLDTIEMILWIDIAEKLWCETC